MRKIAALSLLLLIIICFYSYYYHDNYYPSLSDFLNNPAKYDGMKMEIAGYVRHRDSRLFLERNGLMLEIRGLEVSDGDYVGVAGTLHDSYLQVENYHLNYNYPVKYMVSFAGLFILIYHFFREWKPTLRGFESA